VDFDEVAAWRLGADFNAPLRAGLCHGCARHFSAKLFRGQPAERGHRRRQTVSDNVIRGEVSAAPLDPNANRVFTIRLQEFAGRAATVNLNTPVKSPGRRAHESDGRPPVAKPDIARAAGLSA